MIPLVDILTEEISETTYSDKTYKVLLEDNCVSGHIDEIESVKQTIYFILSTERYKSPIYSWDYGIELVDLFGKPIPYVMVELKRRITEALTQDDRIDGCSEFTYEVIDRNKLHTTFTVNTIYGDINYDMEVRI